MAGPLTPNTKTTLAVVGSAIVCSVCLTLYMERRFSTVERIVERIDDRVARVEVMLDDRVALSQIQNWIEVFSADNPTLKVRPLRK